MFEQSSSQVLFTIRKQNHTNILIVYYLESFNNPINNQSHRVILYLLLEKYMYKICIVGFRIITIREIKIGNNNGI